MKFTLHHIGLACHDSMRSFKWYVQTLGNKVTTSWQARAKHDIAFVGRGSDVMLELVGKPYEPYGQRHLERTGASMSHLGFLVDDLDQAFEKMKADGLRIVWEPRDFFKIRHFAVLDPYGILLEFFNTKGGPPLATPEPQGPVRFHHVSVLTPDLRKTEQFFADTLHMKTVIEHTENNGGFIFMIDEGFDQRTHNFMIEVIGPPTSKVHTMTALLEPREQDILARHGSCIDHFCFVSEDVPGYHKEWVAKGAKVEVEPYRDYGSWISWYKDPNGNDVELLSPIPARVVNQALAEKKPVQTIGVRFDFTQKSLDGAAEPPWREEQYENLRHQT